MQKAFSNHKILNQSWFLCHLEKGSHFPSGAPVSMGWDQLIKPTAVRWSSETCNCCLRAWKLRMPCSRWDQCQCFTEKTPELMLGLEDPNLPAGRVSWRCAVCRSSDTYGSSGQTKPPPQLTQVTSTTETPAQQSIPLDPEWCSYIFSRWAQADWWILAMHNFALGKFSQ